MATAAQLRKHEEERQAYSRRVDAVRKERDQALPRAKAQLAVALTDQALRDGKVDISQREKFGPGQPNEVLSDAELERLAEATLVIDALTSFTDLTSRLTNRRGPQVGPNGGVAAGRI